MNNLLDYDVISVKENKTILKDKTGLYYSLYRLDKNEYQAYIELMKSKYIKKDVYSYNDGNNYHVLFVNKINKSEDSAIINKFIVILDNIFNEYKYQITPQKMELKKLNNLYKLLDNKFNYLEMRIREIELSEFKNDISWMVLSKYHSILDAKIILYDLQTDLFKFIDKKTIIEYGLVFYDIDKNMYNNNEIEPKFKFYYAPKGILYARYYLLFDHLSLMEDFKKNVLKLSSFDKKYFAFMIIYVYILNVNLGIILNNSNINLYMNICKKIDYFIKEFSVILK
jgi:hypothetical protein